MSANWLTTASKAWSANGRSQSVAVAPVDLRPQAPRHRQHALIQVEPGHAARRRHAGGGLARQDAGSAADVEHAVARCDRGDVGELGRPLGEDGGNEVAFIGDGSVVGQLPRCLFGHDCCLFGHGASFPENVRSSLTHDRPRLRDKFGTRRLVRAGTLRERGISSGRRSRKMPLQL